MRILPIIFQKTADKMVPADYDGDQKADIAVYRPSEGLWYILESSDGTLSVQSFGTVEDSPWAGFL